MAAQPTEEAIEMMCDLTAITRQEAVLRLKVRHNSSTLLRKNSCLCQENNNDVTQAINEFFENPGSNPVSSGSRLERICSSLAN